MNHLIQQISLIFQKIIKMDIPIASQNINFPGYGMFWVANSVSSTLSGMEQQKIAGTSP